MGIKINRKRELMSDFPFLLDLFEEHISLARYLGHQDSTITQSNWFHKCLEMNLTACNWFDKDLDDQSLDFYDYIILPQPRLLKFNPKSKVITIFHDIFSILDKQKQLPQSLIFNRLTCQTLINRSHKVIAGSISTFQDINKTFFDKNDFDNPKIQLIYPALPNLQKLLNYNKNKFLHLQKDFKDPQSETRISSKLYILAISGIETRKNWYNLLLAHKFLQIQYNWKLDLVLSGSIIDQKYYKVLVKLIERQQIENVVWQINPSESQKNELLKNCEFVAYPSYYEGFGFPILEAFEHNKVVVTSRISSMSEIGKDACIYANPFSYQNIANCIYLAQTDLNFKRSLEENIAKNKSQYSWHEMINAFEKLLV